MLPEDRIRSFAPLASLLRLHLNYGFLLQGATAVAGAGITQSICLPLLSVYQLSSNGTGQVSARILPLVALRLQVPPSCCLFRILSQLSGRTKPPAPGTMANDRNAATRSTEVCSYHEPGASLVPNTKHKKCHQCQESRTVVITSEVSMTAVMYIIARVIHPSHPVLPAPFRDFS